MTHLQFNLADFPSTWNDDNRMNVLFSIFRSQSVNLVGWHDKMNFWTSLIIELCLKSQTAVISLNTLCLAFERKGRYPQCLDVVLQHMSSLGMIQHIDEFTVIPHEKGWINWGFDVLVRKPAVWGFSSVQSMLNWAKKEDRYVVLDVVTNLASNIYQRYSELQSAEMVESVLYLETFEEKCKDICTGENFDLAIIHLQKKKQICIYEEDGRRIVKLKKSEDGGIAPLTELDRGILRLQKAKTSISKEMDKIDEEIQSSTQEVKQLVKMGSKSKAMVTLKKKKRLELSLQKKMVEAENIDSLLCQLQNSGTEKMVLDAYKAGVQAMKSTSQDDLDLDKIDTTMSEMEEIMDDLAEIQATLAKPIVKEDSLLEFEDELQDLLDNDKESADEPKLDDSTDADLLRRLKALSSSPLSDPSPEKSTKKRQLIGDGS